MMSQKRNNEKPPQLPPRDTSLYSHDLPMVSVAHFIRLTHRTEFKNSLSLQPDYDDENSNSKLKSFFRSKSKETDRKKHGN